MNLQKQDKGILLVTNSLQYSKFFDKIVVLKNGQLVEYGTFEELSQAGSFFSDMYNTCVDCREETKADDITVDEPTDDAISSNGYTKPNSDASFISSSHSPNANSESKKGSTVTKPAESAGLNLITIEDRQVGDVSWSVYKSWMIAAGGIIMVILIVSLFVIAESTNVMTSWWLSFWSENR
jgi:ABC-type multidrug transport system ATPase subunit